MKMKWMVCLALGIACAGCSTVHRGVVAMKISDTVAHVCLDKGEVDVGNNVQLYRNVCTTSTGAKPTLAKCEKKLLGSGTVTSLLNDHYSVVTVASGTDLKEGDFVEK